MDFDEFDEPGTPPVSGQEPVVEPGAAPVVAPVAESGAPAPAADPIPAPEPAPVQLTPEQIEERAVQRMQSWSGRRDKQLTETIIGQVRELLQAQNTPAPAEPNPTAFLDNPDTYIEQVIDRRTQAQTQAQTKFNTTMVSTVNSIMSSDQLVASDPKLGSEIIAELTANPHYVDRTLPPDTAARLAMATAKSNVLSRRYATPVNPLARNTPTAAPLGGVQPAGGPSKPPVKEIKLSEYAAKFAKERGYTPEDIARVLG